MFKPRTINFLTVVFILSIISACSSSTVATTRQRTIVADDLPAGAQTILPTELSKYKDNGYGAWHYGPGLETEKRLDLMPADYNSASVTNSAQLLNFFTITDVHISDKESPAQALTLYSQGGSTSSYTGTMLYTTQFLDAAVQTINTLHKEKPFDFGISLGDMCNAAQFNELRWYIDVMDGKDITPSSGANAGADTIDYQKPYTAAGLDKSIPWYQALGNHDHFWMGFLPANDYIKQALIGTTIIDLGNPFIDATSVDSRGYYMGAIDGSTPFGDIIGSGKDTSFSTAPQVPAADPKRHYLSRNEWMAQFLNTTSNPAGHGFSQSNIDAGFACYSFEPKSDVPIKVIVLDDTQRDDDPNDPVALGYGNVAPGHPSLGYGHGELDAERYAWLISELDKGQAEGKLMIIAAHIPIGVEPAGSMAGWAPAFEAQLLAKLHTYSNLILWVAGHRHYNTITAMKSPDDTHPELGFWQVETSSFKDFPQQFRTIQIMRNSDNNISIFAINVDPIAEDGSLAAKSRFYGIGAQQQAYGNKKILLPTGSYNAELMKQLSADMQAKLKSL